MKAPRRLLSDPQTDPMLRRLLKADVQFDPPPDASQKVWLALSAQLPIPPPSSPPTKAPPTPPNPPPPVPPAAPLAGATSAGAIAGMLKPALLGAALMGTVLVGVELRSTPSATIAHIAPLTTASNRVESTATFVISEGTPAGSFAPPSGSTVAAVSTTEINKKYIGSKENETVPSPVEVSSVLPVPIAPLASSSSTIVEEDRQSRLMEEARLVQRGRDAVASGNFGEALRLLGQAQAMRGVLFQESEALMIEALMRSGQREGASARAQAFLKAFPKSPHANRIRSMIQ